MHLYMCNCGKRCHGLQQWVAHMIATGHKEDKQASERENAK